MKYKKDKDVQFKNSKKVTIGILCFNSKDTIMRAIKGALKQTWENKEIIVIDDSSTDDSYKLINESKYKDQILLIRNHENYGPGYSRNKIIEFFSTSFFGKNLIENLSSVCNFVDKALQRLFCIC